MAGKKITAICWSGGDIVRCKGGILSYEGGVSHAIEIDDETKYVDFQMELADISNCSIDSLSIYYILPVTKKDLITISYDRDLNYMIKFHGDSATANVYVIIKKSVAPNVSYMSWYEYFLLAFFLWTVTASFFPASEDLIRMNLKKQVFDRQSIKTGGIVRGADYSDTYSYNLLVSSSKCFSSFEMEDILTGSQSIGVYESGCAIIRDSGLPLLTGTTIVVTKIKDKDAINSQGAMSTGCRQLFSQYGDLIWNKLGSREYDDSVNALIGICLFHETEYLSAWMKKKGASAQDPASCPACETAVIWIQNQLKQKGNKKKNMLNHVNELSKSLPGSVLDCKIVSSMPNITFNTRRKPLITLTGEQCILKTTEGTKKVCHWVFEF